MASQLEDEEHKRGLQNRLRAATQKRMWAEQEAKKATLAVQEIEQEAIRLQAMLSDTQDMHNTAMVKCATKEQEIVGAQRAREEAEQREAALRQEHDELRVILSDYLMKIGEILQQVGDVAAKKETAYEVERGARELREVAIEEEQRLIEETRNACMTREQGIADSIRKMQELKKAEEEDRQERTTKEAEERQRKSDHYAKRKGEEDEEAVRGSREGDVHGKRANVVRKAKETTRSRAEGGVRGAANMARTEREAKDAHLQQEQDSKQREERERNARENARKTKEREEQEKAEQRIKRYTEALARERLRCRERDESMFQLCPKGLWSDWHALKRFSIISEEFDDIKFCDEQPLTLENVPWPLVHSPEDLDIDLVTWTAIETFFTCARTLMAATEYKILVEKTHRRFHPDKWKSRRLLATVFDDALRDRLETAGNTVAQAVTPLWLASKSI